MTMTRFRQIVLEIREAGETGLVLGREQILLLVFWFAKQSWKSYVQQLEDDVRLGDAAKLRRLLELPFGADWHPHGERSEKEFTVVLLTGPNTRQEGIH
jgi:hypothetical protein